MVKNAKDNTYHNAESDVAYFIGCSAGFGAANDRARKLKIDHIIYSNPATIVFWSDGEKTVVKCYAPDKYDKKTGVLLCCAKRLLGNDKNWYNQIADGEASVQVNKNKDPLAKFRTVTFKFKPEIYIEESK